MTAEEYQSMLSGLRAYAAESVPESGNPFSKLLPSLDALASAGIWSPKMPPLPCSTPGTLWRYCCIPSVGYAGHA